jgi:hypothetical protein
MTYTYEYELRVNTLSPGEGTEPTRRTIARDYVPLLAVGVDDAADSLAAAVARLTADDTYNGHPNRETWAMGLYLGNDYGLYHWTLDTVRQGLEDHPDLADPDNDGARWAGEHLRDQFEAFVGDEAWFMDEDDTRSMLDDIGSRWRIDWEDVARGFMDED